MKIDLALVLFILAGLCWPATCALGGDHASVAADSLRPSAAAGMSTLENFTQVDAGLYFGGEPDDASAFADLARLGIRTVVSVDGARPKVTEAERWGLKYVHIPIGYDGIEGSAKLQLTQLARTAERPWYIHCHHGRHRGPAAAAVVGIAAGKFKADAALELMRRAGTSRQYAGLWRDVAAFQPPPIVAELPDLVPIADVDTLVTCMVQLDRASGNLQLCRQHDWQAVPEHPDITPAREALLLQEGFREAVRALTEAPPQDPHIVAWMKESETEASRLRLALQASRFRDADQQFASVLTRCDRCHTAHRNHK